MICEKCKSKSIKWNFFNKKYLQIGKKIDYNWNLMLKTRIQRGKNNKPDSLTGIGFVDIGLSR